MAPNRLADQRSKTGGMSSAQDFLHFRSTYQGRHDVRRANLVAKKPEHDTFDPRGIQLVQVSAELVERRPIWIPSSTPVGEGKGLVRSGPKVRFRAISKDRVYLPC